MYAIYGNIYHQYIPVMLAYIPYIDPMGWGLVVSEVSISTIHPWSDHPSSNLTQVQHGS
jgi:hypothetical protein